MARRPTIRRPLIMALIVIIISVTISRGQDEEEVEEWSPAVLIPEDYEKATPPRAGERPIEVGVSVKVVIN